MFNAAVNSSYNVELKTQKFKDFMQAQIQKYCCSEIRTTVQTLLAQNPRQSKHENQDPYSLFVGTCGLNLTEKFNSRFSKDKLLFWNFIVDHLTKDRSFLSDYKFLNKTQ